MSRQFWTEQLFWATTDGTAISNSVTETIIFPNVTIPANYMQDGRSLYLAASGRYSTTGTPTGRWRLRWGGVAGTVLADSGTITLGSAVTSAIWQLDIKVQTRLNGATGSLYAIGHVIAYAGVAPTVGSATGAPGIAAMGSAGITVPAAVTVDLTADTALSLTWQSGTQSASNTLQGHNYFGTSPN